MIRRGTTYASKRQFEEALKRWHDGTDDPTIGDTVRYPGVTTWVRVLTAGVEIHVHADTTREAIGRYMELVSQRGYGLPWHVRQGRGGKINKVCIEPDETATKGLFVYTAAPLSEPTDI
jgi:hypothetical protein